MAPGRRVRPTADRVREALFSILGERVPGARLLDAYSGSGALGFEALSRGAREAVFIEACLPIVRRLRETAAALGVAERCRILHGRVLDVVAGGSVPGPFDLILADPPYAASEADPFLALVGPLLAAQGLLVVEGERRAPPLEPPPGCLARIRRVCHGRSCLEFFALHDPAGSG